ncbi:MAG: SDR family NAD(P)-dependent oxidoreductase, partial [Ginsengibacter sp.]
MKLLEKKVSIVTGGSRGIGEAIAYKLAENGSDVAFTYVSSEEKAKEVEEKIKSLGVNAK